MTKHIDLEAFALRVELYQGDTVSLNGEELKGGYMVSLPDCELRVKLRDLSWILPAYVNRYSEELMSEGHFLGGWIDSDGLVCLDVSVNMKERENAELTGREWRQDAIYDVARGEVIYL